MIYVVKLVLVLELWAKEQINVRIAKSKSFNQEKAPKIKRKKMVLKTRVFRTNQ